MFTIGQVSNYL